MHVKDLEGGLEVGGTSGKRQAEGSPRGRPAPAVRVLETGMDAGCVVLVRLGAGGAGVGFECEPLARPAVVLERGPHGRVVDARVSGGLSGLAWPSRLCTTWGSHRSDQPVAQVWRNGLAVAPEGTPVNGPAGMYPY